MSSSSDDLLKQTTPTLKVVLLGDLGVGKTCLRSQFVHHVFTNAYRATIGGDYLTTTVTLPPETPTPSSYRMEHELDESRSSDELAKKRTKTTAPRVVNLQIWDTAGQERFNSISKAFYRGTDVVVLVYDITNYESVLSIRDWFKRFMEFCFVEKPGVIIVGNKVDKVNERCVDLEEIQEIITANTDVSVGDYVEDWETDLREVTSKRLDQVEALFTQVAKVGVAVTDGGVKKRNLKGFDRIDINTLNTLNNSNTTSSRCSC